ncbi:MAG: hypothetical protein KAX40_05595 [Herpetosiphon sp.]|nr:hypothetical protein [Herpetosiphon sp.]
MYHVPPSHEPTKYDTFPRKTLHAFTKFGTVIGAICGLPMLGLIGVLIGGMVGLLVGGGVGLVCSYAYVVVVWKFVMPELLTPQYLGQVYAGCTAAVLATISILLYVQLNIPLLSSLSLIAAVIMGIATIGAWRIARNLVLADE